MILAKGSRYSLSRISEVALEKCFLDCSLSYLSDPELKVILGYIQQRVPQGEKNISEDVANQVIANIETDLKKGYKKPSEATCYQALGSLIKVRIPRAIEKVLSASGKKNQGVSGMILAKSKENDSDNHPVIYVKSVIDGSEADKAGVKRNDRIIEIGPDKVRSKRQAEDLLKSNTPGSSFKLTLIRKGESKNVEIDPSNVEDDAYYKEIEIDYEAICSNVIIPQTRERQIYLKIIRKTFRSIKNPISRVVLMLSVFTEMKPSEIFDIDYEDKENLYSHLEEQIDLEPDEQKLLRNLDSDILKSIENVKVMLHRAKLNFLNGIILKVDKALQRNLLQSDVKIYNVLKSEALIALNKTKLNTR